MIILVTSLKIPTVIISLPGTEMFLQPEDLSSTHNPVCIYAQPYGLPIHFGRPPNQHFVFNAPLRFQIANTALINQHTNNEVESVISVWFTPGSSLHQVSISHSMQAWATAPQSHAGRRMWTKHNLHLCFILSICRRN